MLGPDHTGKITTTGRSAEKLVREAGHDWDAVVQPEKALRHELAMTQEACAVLLGKSERLQHAAMTGPAVSDRYPTGTFSRRRIKKQCLADTDDLTRWEVKFLKSINWRRRSQPLRRPDHLGRICQYRGVD